MTKQFFCTLVFLLWAGVAAAQRVEGTRASAQGPYDAEVTVTNQTNAQRSRGVARALLKVLGNLTGDRNPTARPEIAEAVRNPNEYLTGADFRQDEGVSPSGAPTFTTTLVAHFSQAKVDALIAKAGLGGWPEPRPKPVLWMAIDDGSGPRLVGIQQSNAARPILDRAKARGYRLGLPEGSAAEQAVAGAIWRGDAAAVARASAAYVPPMQLIGKLLRSGAAWRGEWILVDKGRVLARSATRNNDARIAMAGGADIAADALLQKYGRAARPLPPPPPKPPGPLPAGDFDIVITGLHGSADYLRAIGALERMKEVRHMIPRVATQDSLTLHVSASGGHAGFDKAIAAAGVLIPDAPAVAEGQTPPAPATEPASYHLR